MTAIAVQDVDVVENPLERAPIVATDQTFASITETVARVTEDRTPKGWFILFGISVMLLANLGVAVAYLFWTGVGVWGNNSPVGWAWDIVNFVFWIGIGHAGTLI